MSMFNNMNNALRDLWKDIGHSWDLEKKESVSVEMITNQEEDGTLLLLKGAKV